MYEGFSGFPFARLIQGRMPDTDVATTGGYPNLCMNPKKHSPQPASAIMRSNVSVDE